MAGWTQLSGATVHPGGQTVTPKTKSRQRSAVTNGTQLLLGVKNTNAWARRCRDVIASHLSDHPDHLSCRAFDH